MNNEAIMHYRPSSIHYKNGITRQTQHYLKTTKKIREKALNTITLLSPIKGRAAMGLSLMFALVVTTFLVANHNKDYSRKNKT